ncbi:hypothetical protein ACFWAN_16415 [Streptomyces mirabilis]|uniref:hypothetical protein n=1 Tax=Streptomyces mirabilis TaxID=68239 RepID=UPI00365D19E8
MDASTTWPEPTIDDYAERTTATVAAWKNMNGRQTGDPAKLARALLAIADQDQPLLRFVAGADAIEGVEAKARNSSPRPRLRANWAATWHTTTPAPERGRGWCRRRLAGLGRPDRSGGLTVIAVRTVHTGVVDQDVDHASVAAAATEASPHGRCSHTTVTAFAARRRFGVIEPVSTDEPMTSRSGAASKSRTKCECTPVSP